MARDLGAKCRICRREGMKLFLKGERCLTEKCAIERRSYPPGEHGRGRIKQSEYLLQLREKQKARRYYGLLEKQFRTYYDKASKRSGVTGEEHDFGDLGCADGLAGAFRRRLDQVPSGGVLRSVVSDPSAREDLPALARMLGHRVVSVEEVAGGRLVITVEKT